MPQTSTAFLHAETGPDPRARATAPVVLVLGDAVDALFVDADGTRLASVQRHGCVWVRCDNPDRLSPTLAALRRGSHHARPDALLLTVVPARYADAADLEFSLRDTKRRIADALRLRGLRIPLYVSIYQRWSTSGGDHDALGMAGAHPLRAHDIADAVCDALVRRPRAATTDAHRDALAGHLVGWSARHVLAPIESPRLTFAPCPLHGAAWIDAGPCTEASSWSRDLSAQRGMAAPAPAPMEDSWPLPSALVDALPIRRRLTRPTRWLAYSIAALAAACVAGTGVSFTKNLALYRHTAMQLDNYQRTPAQHVKARADAWAALRTTRDAFDRYRRLGAPWSLGLGLHDGYLPLYRLNAAIQAYQPPVDPPTILTLDTLSLFDTGRATLRSGTIRSMVDAAAWIQRHPDKRVLIAGHTDSTGDAASNLRLAHARAASVRDWLAEATATPATRFATQGYGDTRPLESNDTVAGRARNRRVEITLLPETSTPPP